ncbi:hypothetical protein FJT64_009817 [Amphibalanus amphitrite]|uniref:Helitron helicase-like domain-containing protein n=1 Tax=Amphibalanus amphitrite TaxID=1232801 RepID=A0A6A4VS73_AMPAM|nr:hypothetical protein FJT64_009817 [Amphibalanus amphitrite]
MNVEGVSPPTPFLARPGKPALPWSDWIFSFHNYLTALGGEAYSTERKTALLLHCVGAEAQRVYRTLPVQPRREDEDEFHAAERQLAEFYEPQVNVIAERFFFRQRRQESHEPTADYVAALRRLAVNCSFGQMTDAMIRDQVVEATVHPILRERFLQDKGLTLDRVLEIAEAFERSRREATAMAGPARPAADGAQMPVPAEEADLHEDSSAEEEVIALLTDEESVLTEQDVRTASAADPELQQLRHQIKRGWPSSAKACPVEVQPYFKMRHELWVRNDDVILRGAQQPVARLDTGARDTVCPHCGALLWREERATLCCSGGKARDGERPSFAQIYVNDPDCDDPAAEAALRLGHVPLPRGTREPERARLLTLLEQLQVLLRQVNPYVQDFIHAAELPEEEVQQQRLVVSADARPADQHPRRYNRAEGFREVAVLMDEEPVHQDIVLRRRADAEGPFLQTVNETHRAFEALHFVLLLPFGTDGWQPDLRQAVANGRGDVRGVSLMQYYAHRLQLRPDLDDSLFRAGRLFQEYVCMAFARVETQRLLYLARNQAGLRAELYQRLQDALPGDAERELGGGDRVGQRVILPASFTGGPRYYQRR